MKKLISVFSILLILLAGSFGQEKIDNRALQKALTRKLRTEDIRAYRTMNRINFKPLVMDETTSKLCGRPLTVMTVSSSHYKAGTVLYLPRVVYYINDIAQKGLMTFSETKQFPLGSVIVKEKQENQTENSVKTITAMKKIKARNTEDSWDYRIYDVAMWKEIKQTTFASRTKSAYTPAVKCIDCHRKYRENDFISPQGMNLFFPLK